MHRPYGVARGHTRGLASASIDSDDCAVDAEAEAAQLTTDRAGDAHARAERHRRGRACRRAAAGNSARNATSNSPLSMRSGASSLTSHSSACRAPRLLTAHHCAMVLADDAADAADAADAPRDDEAAAGRRGTPGMMPLGLNPGMVNPMMMQLAPGMMPPATMTPTAASAESEAEVFSPLSSRLFPMPVHAPPVRPNPACSGCFACSACPACDLPEASPAPCLTMRGDASNRRPRHPLARTARAPSRPQTCPLMRLLVGFLMRRLQQRAPHRPVRHRCFPSMARWLQSRRRILPPAASRRRLP